MDSPPPPSAVPSPEDVEADGDKSAPKSFFEAFVRSLKFTAICTASNDRWRSIAAIPPSSADSRSSGRRPNHCWKKVVRSNLCVLKLDLIVEVGAATDDQGLFSATNIWIESHAPPVPLVW